MSQSWCKRFPLKYLDQSVCWSSTTSNVTHLSLLNEGLTLDTVDVTLPENDMVKHVPNEHTHTIICLSIVCMTDLVTWRLGLWQHPSTIAPFAGETLLILLDCLVLRSLLVCLSGSKIVHLLLLLLRRLVVLLHPLFGKSVNSVECYWLGDEILNQGKIEIELLCSRWKSYIVQ